MALTLADAVTEVRDVLNEEQPVFWKDTQIQKWIKEGCRLFSSRSLMVEAEDVIDPLVANQLSYSSSDVNATWIGTILEAYSAYYKDGNTYKGLIKSHPRRVGNLSTFTPGIPKYYSLHNKKLYIWPLTTQAIVDNSATITVLYAKYTEDIADIADEYQHIAILYALAKAKEKDQKFAEANNFMAQFDNAVGFERQDKHDREEDTLDQFKTKKRGSRRA